MDSNDTFTSNPTPHCITARANLNVLSKKALEVRRIRTPAANPKITSSINPCNYHAGLSHVSFEVQFSDGISWVARLPLRAIDHPEEEKCVMRSEVAAMKIVHDQTRIPVPEIFAFQPEASDEVGYPYIFMAIIHGRSVGITSIPSQYQHKVAKQIASMIHQLSQITFEGIGMIWAGKDVQKNHQPPLLPMMDNNKPHDGVPPHAAVGPASWESFFQQRQRQNEKMLEMHPDDENWKTATCVLKLCPGYFLVENWHRGPFPLYHPSMHAGNLLFTEEYDVAGLIGWSGVRAAPMELLAASAGSVPLISMPGLRARQLDFRRLVAEELATSEEQTGTDGPFRLSAYMLGDRGEMITRYSQINKMNSLLVAKAIASSIFAEEVSWDNLERICGPMGDSLR